MNHVYKKTFNICINSIIDLTKFNFQTFELTHNILCKYNTKKQTK